MRPTMGRPSQQMRTTTGDHMTPGPSLDQNVNQLIRVHTSAVTFQKQHALIDQLETATTQIGNDGGRSNEPRIPINAAAIDLQQHIKKSALDIEQSRTNDPTGGLRVIIKKWETEDRDDWKSFLADATQRMVDDIKHLLMPTPKRRPLNTECPSCGNKYHGEDNKPALTAGVYEDDGILKHPADYDIHCAACDAIWEGKDMNWIVHILNPKKSAA